MAITKVKEVDTKSLNKALASGQKSNNNLSSKLLKTKADTGTKKKDSGPKLLVLKNSLKKFKTMYK